MCLLLDLFLASICLIQFLIRAADLPNDYAQIFFLPLASVKVTESDAAGQGIGVCGEVCTCEVCTCEVCTCEVCTCEEPAADMILRFVNQLYT